MPAYLKNYRNADSAAFDVLPAALLKFHGDILPCIGAKMPTL